LTLLESSLSSSDVGNKKDVEEEESKRNIGDIVSLNIGTNDKPKILKIGAQCPDEEKQRFMELFCEFKDVFSCSYEDIYGFYPNVIQNVIPIKEEENSVR
jgi:hypothetical protein